MKFLCSNCKAKYQIADEKVAGRTLRMTCRRCQEEIVIRGEPVAAAPAYAPQPAPLGRINVPSPAAPSPLGAEFQVQLAQSVRASAVPGLDEWHVAINDVPVGPIRREDIARKLAQGAIDLDSLAWREGMEDWQAIRDIPELAALSIPPPAVPLPAPPPLAMPGARPVAQPMAAQYAVDSWAQPQPERPSQILVNPVLDPGTAERRSTPSWPAMFAVACGFAFLMSGMTILGARWLRDPPRTNGAATGEAGAPAPAPQAQPAQPVLEVPEEQAEPEPEQMVIGLDDPALQNDSRGSAARPSSASATASKSKQKELTAEQKAMLARMGGDTGTNLSGLSTNSDLGRPRATGTLSAADVSKVVVNGRKDLQRCYETALRGSGSTETVRLDVELTVTPSGNVTNVKTKGSGLPGMAQCIERTVKMWRFPQSGESSPVRFPIVFQPGA